MLLDANLEKTKGFGYENYELILERVLREFNPTDLLLSQGYMYQSYRELLSLMY